MEPSNEMKRWSTLEHRWTPSKPFAKRSQMQRVTCPRVYIHQEYWEEAIPQRQGKQTHGFQTKEGRQGRPTQQAQGLLCLWSKRFEAQKWKCLQTFCITRNDQILYLRITTKGLMTYKFMTMKYTYVERAWEGFYSCGKRFTYGNGQTRNRKWISPKQDFELT